MAPEILFTVEELADYLKMQPITIYKHAAAGKLPGFKVGSKWRFKKSTIDKWIEDQERKSVDMKRTHIESFPKLRIGDLELRVPIIQGGMGVRISKANLTAAVSECGGMGAIASVGLGDELESLNVNYANKSAEALRAVIRETKTKTDKAFAVNIMVALTNYESLCRVCSDEKVGAILTGAGLPLRLPAYVEDKNVKLIPIISSAKAADLIYRHWQKRYNKVPDGFVVEGPLAGGHLGFSREEINSSISIYKIVSDVKEAIRKLSSGRDVAIIAAGGIFTGKDIIKALAAGADGVQMATRFIATHECDAIDELKQACLNSKKDDVAIIDSPVGLPGRVLMNKFVEKILRGEKIKFRCPYKCLKTCKQNEAQFCLAMALVNASRGNFDAGFVMTGANVYKLDKIVTVKELFEQLRKEAYE